MLEGRRVGGMWRELGGWRGERKRTIIEGGKGERDRCPACAWSVDEIS